MYVLRCSDQLTTLQRTLEAELAVCQTSHNAAPVDDASKLLKNDGFKQNVSLGIFSRVISFLRKPGFLAGSWRCNSVENRLGDTGTTKKTFFCRAKR